MKNVCILVVDDNSIIVELVRHMFILRLEEGCRGYEIVSAPDGVHGVELARKVHPDVIILDFHLPRMNGYEVIQALKTLGNTVPIIMITAASPLGQVQLAIDACDVYLPKPFRPDLLVHHVHDQLSRQRYSVGA